MTESSGPTRSGSFGAGKRSPRTSWQLSHSSFWNTSRPLVGSPFGQGESPAPRCPVDVRTHGLLSSPPALVPSDCACGGAAGLAPAGQGRERSRASASASVSQRATVMRAPPSARRESRKRFYLKRVTRDPALRTSRGASGGGCARRARVADDARADGADSPPAGRCQEVPDVAMLGEGRQDPLRRKRQHELAGPGTAPGRRPGSIQRALTISNPSGSGGLVAGPATPTKNRVS